MTLQEEAILFLLENVNFGINPDPAKKAHELAQRFRDPYSVGHHRETSRGETGFGSTDKPEPPKPEPKLRTHTGSLSKKLRGRIDE
jgi:hypothetical protein